MIGLGDSDPLPNGGPGVYKFATHRDYLFDFLEQVGATERVTLVIHDWGSGVQVLVMLAQRFPERITSIAFMEAIIRPSMCRCHLPNHSRDLLCFRSERGKVRLFAEQFLHRADIDWRTRILSNRGRQGGIPQTISTSRRKS